MRTQAVRRSSTGLAIAQAWRLIRTIPADANRADETGAMLLCVALVTLSMVLLWYGATA